MKKIPMLHRLLALILALQLVLIPVWATGSEETPDEGVVQSQEQTDSAQEETSEATEETVPQSVIFTIPENIAGDASLIYGCSSIDASNSLIAESEITMDAGAALMYELNTGSMLYAYNPDQKMYPASVTKIMTCLVALEYGNVDDIITVSSYVVANRDPYGSNCALVAGEELSLEELLYCLMVSSANDAASAISEHIAGSESAFVELMNQKAAELGCTGTHFVNPHGLHDENHYTTARDLAKILMAALEYDLFREIYSTKTYTVPATNMSEARELTSTNYMIEDSYIDYYYDSRVIGGKTGHTTPAGRCLAAVSESRDMQLLTVVLGGTTGTNSNGTVSYGSFKTTKNLINYGFGNCSVTQVLSADAVMEQFSVSGGANDTQAVVKESVRTILPSEFDLSLLKYDYVLTDGALTAPIEVGEPLGFVRVWYQNKCLAQKEVYAATASTVKNQLILDLSDGDSSSEDGTICKILLVAAVILLAVIAVMLVTSRIQKARARARRKKSRNNTRTTNSRRSR